MAAPLKVDYAFDAEDLKSSAKIVKFAILRKHEDQDATQGQELASFEETMLPHMDAAHNLSSKRLTYVHLSLSVDFMAPTAGPGS